MELANVVKDPAVIAGDVLTIVFLLAVIVLPLWLKRKREK